MKKFILSSLGITASALALLSLGSCGKKAEVDPIDDNYRVMYEIFTGSFSDSDGDGIGDLKGIENRLDYLNDGNINSSSDLGVQGLWLTPIFQSSSYHKYDVIDYYTIDYDFGTLDDLKNLLDDCHKRNVKVILDLVINHTSTANNWFVQFRNAHKSGDTSSKYYDWYVYSDTKKPGYYVLSDTNEYYEANFDSGMPELNYDNEEVREEMLKVAKYWLDQGVDGFRFDAARYIYYGDTEKNVDFWKWYCGELKAYKEDVFTVGEVLNAGVIEETAYYPALDVFSFETSGAEGLIAQGASGQGTYKYTSNIVSNLKGYKAQNENAMMSALISNHDMNRMSGNLSASTGKAQMAANLLILTQGTPFIYYGEEIGMKGTKDGDTDANRRLAMLWGDGDTVKDPVGATGAEQPNGTVKSQTKDKNSLLNYYKKVIKVRNNHPEIARGDYELLKVPSGTKSQGGFIITYNDSKIALIHNASTEAFTIDLSTMDGNFTELLDSVGMNSSSVKNGILTIGGQTSVILK